MTVTSDELRWLIVCAALVLVLLWEQYAPMRRTTAATIRARWPTHIGLLLVNNAPVVALSAIVALPAVQAPRGLLGGAAVPGWLAFLITIAALDLVRYGVHVAQHQVPLLWRFHRVHHADTEYDFTTSFRFHPFDAALAAAVSYLGLLVLGAPPLAVLAAEILRQISDAIGHGNIRLPDAVDRGLRAVFVTPNVHRVHHSVRREETDSNYGSLLTWWDRLFGTYRPQPQDGHQAMRIGLEEFRSPPQQRLLPLLLLPFVGKRT